MSNQISEIYSTVLQNYQSWLGEPVRVYRSDILEEALSPYFRIFEYKKENYSLLCTLGASESIIPHSEKMFNDIRGIRHEYIIHSEGHYSLEISQILLMLSVYTFRTNAFIASGHLVPLGHTEKFLRSFGMSYLYLTDPYKDDAKLYSSDCNGQIDTPLFLLQTLWAIPIYQSEAEHARKIGPEQFDQLCFHTGLRAEDFNRKPLLIPDT